MTIQNKIIIAVGMWAIVLCAVLWGEVYASRYNNDTTNITNNYLTENTIISGTSDEDLAAGLAMALAAGAHQFDFSTYDYQGSIVGSWETGDDENAVSFGLAKHFKKVNALLHTSYTQSSGEHYITFGGTFRF